MSWQLNLSWTPALPKKIMMFLHFSEVTKTPVGGIDVHLCCTTLIVHVSRQRKFLTLLGFKEGVG